MKRRLRHAALPLGCACLFLGSAPYSEAFLSHRRPNNITSRHLPPRIPTFCQSTAPKQYTITSSQTRHATLLHSSTSDSTELAFWITSFAATHIGFSAIRTRMIDALGQAADTLGLVGNTEWKLPDFWLGDTSSGNNLFPNMETTGRQIYRILYTVVAFATLGLALQKYLDDNDTTMLSTEHSFAFYTAVLANTAALSSLANASPLGLMPSFQPSEDNDMLMIQRDDTRKLAAYGLTRITRHPLILPVAIWGVANAIQCGSQLDDWLLFGGLSLYSILGCLAQDLRVSKQEGSVGTTFLTATDESSRLQDFYQSTSFIPFAAVLDGRQLMSDILREVPWLAVTLALPVGYIIEDKMIQWLVKV
jgi:uncharacterized membrane protein